MVDRVTVPAEPGITHTPADNAITPENPGKPKWLPDKFKSPEDMAKSYQELEKQYTQLRQGKAPVDETPPEEKPDAPLEEVDGKQATVEDVKELLPGFSEDQIMEFSETAWETGTLKDDQYAALEAKGFSREIVDQYIQGQMALAEGQRNALINAGGGEAKVNEMFSWAATNLDKATIDNFNAKFDAGGPDAFMAMELLASKYAQSGKAGASGLVTGAATAPNVSTDVFRSVAQVQEAMSDPRYKTDPAFRSEVAKKLGRSNVL